MAKELKKGDLVQIIQNHTGGFMHYLKIGTLARVVEATSISPEVRGLNKTNQIIQQTVALTDILKLESMAKNPIQVAACLKAANDLLQANNTVTTLEIKTKLMNDSTTSLYFWDQQLVHDIMADAHNNGTYAIVQDNGTYRTYSATTLPTTLQKKRGRGRPAGVKNAPKAIVPTAPVTQPKKGPGRPKKVIATLPTTPQTPAKRSVGRPRKVAATPAPAPTPQPARAAKKTGYTYINRTKALSLMQNNHGHFFTADFIDKNGEPRTMNCQYLKDQTTSPLGYVKVKEQALVRKGEPAIRSVNLQTLKTLRIAKVNYKLR